MGVKACDLPYCRCLNGPHLLPVTNSAPVAPSPLRILAPLTALSLVLLMHAAAWQGVAGDTSARRSDLVVSAVQVRTVAPAPAVATAVASVAATVAAAPAPAAPRRAIPAPVPVPDAEPASSDAPTLLAAAAASATAAAPDDAEVAPVYPTRLPPSAVLRFDLRRSGFSGRSELQWQNLGVQGQYQARLEGSVAGFRVFTWASQGRVDKAGIAPLRFTDERRGKSLQAANFQREAGKITFSGPSTEYPLVAGAQDRLSWMIQLGAVLNARSAPPTAGERLSFFVAGAKGEGEVWHFVGQGLQNVNLQDRPTPAWRFVREPRKPHDTRIEVWLDPARHYLPVRYRQSSEGTTDVLDLILQEMQIAS
jgi:hypothetical protein